ncbi:immunoglobulin epsilon heavy chain-like [Leucoraja erinacea]|uniref:immunoglobulin epsilon heavy chain-like n=1 Tax=Leucoraja erinaceus TaxID=7782 RepID=UPI0024581E4A|nr:immunoglobulin epsilon heavy chain-like [Leucoraja erinacea]
MGVAAYLCLLLSCLPGVRSAVVLNQKPTEAAKSGESLKLTCVTSGFSLSTYSVSWVKQVPGKGLEWVAVMWNGGGKDYAPAFSGRFTVSKDSSNVYLQMTRLSLADTATYYCARFTWENESVCLDYWGAGTSLTVTSEDVVLPSVHITSSCNTESGQEISILCLVKDYLPEIISQTWSTSSGVINNGITKYPPVLGQNNKYTMSSLLRVSVADWNRKTYYCKAGSKPDNMVKTEIQKLKVTPQLIPLVPSPETLHNQTTAVLGCMISGFSPDNIKVSWKKAGLNQAGVVLPSTPRTNGGFETVAYLPLNMEEWTNKQEYTCEVTHAPSGFSDKINMRYQEALAVFIQNPGMKEIWINKTATLVCSVICSDPSQVHLTWKVGGKGRSEGVMTRTPSHEGTQNPVTSELRTSVEEWTSGVEFVCFAQQSSSSSPVSARTKHNKVEPNKPEVRLLLPAHEETKHSHKVTLECVVSGFYPDLINVTWSKDGALISNNTSAAPTALEQGGTFSASHFLTMSTEDWKSGSRFNCTVYHRASNTIITKDVKNIQVLAVFIQNPGMKEIWINKTATLVCSVICSDPSQVHLTWKVGGKERSEGVMTRTPSHEGTQNPVTSELRTSVEEWTSGVEFVCFAQQSSSSSPVSARTNHNKVEPNKPEVRLLLQTHEETKHSHKVTLECVVSGFYPDLINVAWSKDDALISNNTSAAPTALEQGGTFSASHFLTMSTEDWKSGSRFNCTVYHRASNTIITKDVKNIQDECSDTRPSVTLSKPSFEEIWINKTATILCKVVHGDLEGFRVTWQVNEMKREDGVTTRGVEKIGGTDTITSGLTVPAAEWESGALYTCVVEDKSLPTPERRSLQKLTDGVEVRPQVYLLPPSLDEVETDKTATLTCLVTKFSPADIYVAWMANDTLLKTGIVNQPVTKDTRNGWNTMTSQLKVSPEDWNCGTTFSCVVGHGSITTSLFRSINKSHSKPTLVNVSLVLTDSFKSCV